MTDDIDTLDREITEDQDIQDAEPVELDDTPKVREDDVAEFEPDV